MRKVIPVVLMLMIAVAAKGQQSLAPGRAPYYDFTTGIKIQGSFGGVGACLLSTGTGSQWGTCGGAGNLPGVSSYNTNGLQTVGGMLNPFADFVQQSSAPSNPPSGDGRVWVDTSGHWNCKLNSGADCAVTSTAILPKGIPEYAADYWLSTADGHSGQDYCYAITQAYAFIKSFFPLSQATIKLSNGIHKCWSSVLIDGSVYIAGNGAILEPQSGGAGGVWGSAPTTLSGCTAETGSQVITCPSTTGAILGERVGGVGIPVGAYINCLGIWSGSTCQASSTQLTISLPSFLEIVGKSTAGSPTITGVGLLNSITTGMVIKDNNFSIGTTTTAIHYGGSSATDTQTVTLSSNAVQSLNSDVLRILSPWSTVLKLQQYAPVLMWTRNATAGVTNCITAPEGPCIYSGLSDLTIFDPTYQGVSGVIGIERSGYDGFHQANVQVKGVSGPASIIGGRLTAGAATSSSGSGKLRESDEINENFMLSADWSTGTAAVELMTGVPDCNWIGGTCANPDEINQIGISQFHDDLNNGPSLLVGTYNPAGWYGATKPVTNCAVTSNVATLTVTNTWIVGQTFTMLGSTACSFLNGHSYPIATDDGTHITFALWTSHANVAATADVGTGVGYSLGTYGPRLIWFGNDCQFEDQQESGPGVPSRLQPTPTDNMIIRAATQMGYSGCEFAGAGWGRFVYHSFGDDGPVVSGNTRWGARVKGLKYTVDTTHARDATPYVVYTSDPQSNGNFDMSGAWNGTAARVTDTGSCAAPGCNVYFTSAAVNTSTFAGNAAGHVLFLSAPLFGSTTLGPGATLQMGQPPRFAAFENSSITPLLYGSAVLDLGDDTFQSYGEASGGGNHMWAGAPPSIANYYGAFDIETETGGFPFAGFVAHNVGVGGNLTWRQCIDALTGECGYTEFNNIGGVADPSNLNTFSIAFTHGLGIVPFTVHKSGQVDVYSLDINGTHPLTGVQGTTGTKVFSCTGSFTSGHYVKVDTDGNCIDGGTGTGGSSLTITDVTAATCTPTSGMYVNRNTTTTTAVTCTLPAPTQGTQICLLNATPSASSTLETGALKLLVASPSTQNILLSGTITTTTNGYIQSTGAAGDMACVTGLSSTQWQANPSGGSWTAF